MNDGTQIKVQFQNSVTNEKRLKEYKKILSSIRSTLSGIDKGTLEQIEKSAKELEKTDDEVKEINNESKKISKNFTEGFNYTKFREFTRILGNIVEKITSIVDKSNQYLEDFNLFQVAYRGNYTEATKLVNKLSEMYGLDEDWLVKTTSQFKQLSNAMGLANETGEKVAELMTKMSIDISSLYNIDVSRASSILQSALAGLIFYVWLA